MFISLPICPLSGTETTLEYYEPASQKHCPQPPAGPCARICYLVHHIGKENEDRQFLLENDEYRAQYHAYLQQLVDEYVNGGRFDEVYNRGRGRLIMRWSFSLEYKHCYNVLI